MDAFGEHVDGERSTGKTAERRRRPQPLVVAAAGIEADDEIHRAHARRKQLEVGRKIVAAAFLAGFDHADATRMRYTLRLQRADGGERGEHRIPVVGAAAAIELAVGRAPAATDRVRHATRSSRAACRGDHRVEPSMIRCPARRSKAPACGPADERFRRSCREPAAPAPRLRQDESRARYGRLLPSAGRNEATWPGCECTRQVAGRSSHPSCALRTRPMRRCSSNFHSEDHDAGA